MCRSFAAPVLVYAAVLAAFPCPSGKAWAQNTSGAEPFDFEKASRNVPKPREIWPLVAKHVIPLQFKILSDEVAPSDTDPSQRLRKVTAHFYSQELAGKKWGHPCVILLPADNARNRTPERRGKVVIVGSPGRDYFPVHVAKYGEPIAARTGYPTMVLSNPGRYPDGFDIEGDMGVLSRLRKQTGKNYYNMNCQLAVVYLQAMNALQGFLGVDDLKAVVGGHSKRGRSATVAAAMDSRVASVIIMGNEGVYATDRIQWHLSFHHAFFQDQVTVPVFYLGATNEDGYRMFNVNILEERLRRPMTVEMIPNYCHSNFSEIQFMDFMMWVAHVFDGRPLTRITDVSHRRQEGRTVFRAKIEGDAKIQVVKAWYVYTDDPAWRDLMWYHLLMRRVGDHYEAVLPGKMPDAFLVEVGDIAGGFPGYVSSTPQKLTDAPVEERRSRGSRPRLWEPPGPIANSSTAFQIDGALEGEDLQIKSKSKGVTVSQQAIRIADNPPLSRGRLLFVRLERKGDSVELAVPPSVTPGTYELKVRLVTSWDYAIVRLKLNDTPLGEPVDTYSPEISTTWTALGEVSVKAGENVVCLEAVGKGGASRGYYAGIDAVVFVPVR